MVPPLSGGTTYTTQVDSLLEISLKDNSAVSLKTMSLGRNNISKSALIAIATAIPLLTPLQIDPVQAQQRSVSELQNALQTAVCQNDWNQALQLAGNLIGADGISADYRAQLMEYRTQLRSWRDAGARIANLPNCQNTPPVAATPIPAPQHSSAANWERVAESLNGGEVGRNSPFVPTTPSSTSSIQNRNSGQNGVLSRAQQCNQVSRIISPAMNETGRLVQNSSPQNVVQTIQQAIELAEQTRTGLQAISLTDPSLRSSQQQLIANYGNLIPTSRAIISAFERRDQAGVMSALNTLIPIAEQEAVIIRAIVNYCGSSPA